MQCCFFHFFMGGAMMSPFPDARDRGTIWVHREGEHFLQDPSVTIQSLKLFGNNPFLSPSFTLPLVPRGGEGLCLQWGMLKHRAVLCRAYSAPSLSSPIRTAQREGVMGGHQKKPWVPLAPIPSMNLLPIRGIYWGNCHFYGFPRSVFQLIMRNTSRSYLKSPRT